MAAAVTWTKSEWRIFRMTIDEYAPRSATVAAALRGMEMTDGDEPKEMGWMALRVTGVTNKGKKCKFHSFMLKIKQKYYFLNLKQIF